MRTSIALKSPLSRYSNPRPGPSLSSTSRSHSITLHHTHSNQFTDGLIDFNEFMLEKLEQFRVK